jgi:hypothetical protein
MKEQFDFIAPTGAELQGTSELIASAASCTFIASDPTATNAYVHNGESEVFWDTSTTQMIVAAPLFTDRDGDDWPAHHLIPADAEPLSAETLRLFALESALGEALDAATGSLEAVRGVLKVLGSATPETSELITLLTLYAERDRPKRPQRHTARPSSLIDHLAIEYARAKAASIAAKDRELRAQEEESPRVACADCAWTGRERDCGEIVSLPQRVAPGEIMPAGECPECGALCHLVDEVEA